MKSSDTRTHMCTNNNTTQKMQHAHHSHTHPVRGATTNTLRNHARSTPRKHNNTNTTNASGTKKRALTACHPDQRASHVGKRTVNISDTRPHMQENNNTTQLTDAVRMLTTAIIRTTTKSLPNHAKTTPRKHNDTNTTNASNTK